MIKKMRQKGFTLIEAMVVVVMLGILAALAYPSFKSTLERGRADAAKNEFSKALAYARTEAISRNKAIGICPQQAGNNNACGGASDWNNGFFVFVDKNRDDNYKASDDEIIMHYHLKQPVVLTFSSEVTKFIWQPGGLQMKTMPSSLPNTTLTVIPSKDSKYNKNIKECRIANTGRLICADKTDQD